MGRSWAILTGLGAILGRFGAGWGSQKRCFSTGFSMFLEKSRFGIKMIILAGLEAFLGHLGAILGPLGPNLGRFGFPRGPKREAKRDPRDTQNETRMTSIFGSILGQISDRFWSPRKWASSSGAECAGPGKTLEFNKFEDFSKTVQTRSDPSGGGGFNRAARSPPGQGIREEY